jgi:HPt (histidine-containing phosphotransfer) domain-containing protein
MRPDDNPDKVREQSRRRAAVRAGQEEGWERLEQLRILLGPKFQMAVTAFRRDTSARLASLREAGLRADLAQMARLTHALSGSCASMGAIQLTALCRKLELHCQDARLDGWAQCLDRIVAESAHFAARLDRLLLDGPLLPEEAAEPPKTC